MTIMAWILWILVWGLIGYGTIRAILTYIRIKRETRAWTAYMNYRNAVMRNPGKFNSVNLSYNPFEDLKKEKDLA